MRNIKNELIELLQKNNKSWDDVAFVQINGIRLFDKYDFLSKIEGFKLKDYRNNIIVVGLGWWIEWEEDNEGYGAEFFFRQFPMMSQTVKNFTLEMLE